LFMPEGGGGHLSLGITKLYVRIPIDRMAPLIGKGGKVIHELEERTNTLITVDEVNASASIEPASPETTMDKLLKARDFILAVSAGFSPEKAWRLLDEGQVLVIIDLKDVVGGSSNHLTRVKGRIIGEGGKAKKNLEEMTGVDLNIHDDKVAIIGDYESAQIVREAIHMLIQGRMHSTVYRFIDRAMRKVRRSRMLDLWRRRTQDKIG